MPTITGTLKDSLGVAANCTLETSLTSVAAHLGTLILTAASLDVLAGVVSITPVPNAQMVPAGTTYGFAVRDAADIQRSTTSGVTVTAAMNTLDDIL